MKSFICILLFSCAYTLAEDKYFPKDFWFGVTSGAYQVEGGWNADGKGISIWDKLLHDNSDFAYDHANGDVAADTYTHGIDDVAYLKNISVTHYRFSISWTRILPDGLASTEVNEAGVAYYNRLIDALIEANITPLVTLYQWDLPYYLQEMGGFLNEDIQNWFEDYARICFERFGDRVKYWLTFNDPLSICQDGYEDGTKAPAIKHEGTGTYECAYNVLLSHARAFRLYDDVFRYEQNGKGISIWDKLLHDNSDFAYDHANGDVAADTYTHGIDDVAYLKNISVTHYRFSISWTRILPDGLASTEVNEAGVAYYNRLIDALIEANITPLVTLYQWDLPYYLQEMGGFLNEDIQNWFEDYARICFERFGDRVKYWLTFNDPLSICQDGYEDGTKAPAIKHEGTGTYECAYNVLLSHARAFRLYDDVFRYEQNGQVSIAVNSTWYAPGDSQSQKDIDAAYRNIIFSYHLWMTPIVQGDWPELIKLTVEENSREEGLSKSRLPEFTDEQKKLLRGSLDFVALNFYTSYLCTHGGDWVNKTSSIYRDIQVDCWQPEGYEPGTGWLRYTPWGIRSMVNHVKLVYGNLPLIITENGYSGWADKGDLKDTFRIYYHRMYLSYLLDAILEDGCNVFGYTATSFLDEFEWAEGYQTKFGMVHVDFNDNSRPRTRKHSSYIYENIIKTRKIDFSYNPDFPSNQN